MSGKLLLRTTRRSQALQPLSLSPHRELKRFRTRNYASGDQASLELAEEWTNPKRLSIHVSDLWSRKQLKQFLCKIGVTTVLAQQKPLQRKQLQPVTHSPRQLGEIPNHSVFGNRTNAYLQSSETDRQPSVKGSSTAPPVRMSLQGGESARQGRLERLLETVEATQEQNARSRKDLKVVYSRFLQSKGRVGKRSLG